MPGFASAFRGNVVEVRQWSDTHVRSYGGGGYVDPKFGGVVRAPTIKSDVIQRKIVVLRNKTGDEEFDLSNADMLFVKGHDVAVVWDSMNSTQRGDI